MMVTHFKNICKLCQNAQCGHSHVITQKGVPKGASPLWRFSYSMPTCFKCAHISVWLSLSWLLYIIKISFLKSVRAFIDCPLSTHLLSLLLFPFIIFLRLLSVWNILVICLFIHLSALGLYWTLYVPDSMLGPKGHKSKWDIVSAFMELET